MTSIKTCLVLGKIKETSKLKRAILKKKWKYLMDICWYQFNFFKICLGFIHHVKKFSLMGDVVKVLSKLNTPPLNKNNKNAIRFSRGIG